MLTSRNKLTAHHSRGEGVTMIPQRKKLEYQDSSSVTPAKKVQLYPEAGMMVTPDAVK